jgi:acetylglutamate kinase
MTISTERKILIKIGGSTLGAGDTTMADVAALRRDGARVIVVHGGGPEVTSWLAKMGIRAEFVDGLRVTDDASLDVATAVLAGLVNKRLTAELSAAGAPAVGLSGVDGALMRCTVELPKLGHVAGALDVDPSVIESLLDSGFVPVIAPIAVGGDGVSLLNTNADTAAGAIAVAMAVQHLVFLTDVDGILDSHGRLLRKVPLDMAEGLIGSGVVKGGMIPKLRACLAAGRAGIEAHIVNGAEPGVLTRCLDGTATGTAVA